LFVFLNVKNIHDTQDVIDQNLIFPEVMQIEYEHSLTIKKIFADGLWIWFRKTNLRMYLNYKSDIKVLSGSRLTCSTNVLLSFYLK